LNAVIHSDRLSLVLLPPAFLRAVVKHDLSEARTILGVSLPPGLLDSTDVMSLRLRQLEAAPTVAPWLLRAIVLQKPRTMIGYIGFHTAPSAEYLHPYSPGGVEFGFTVYPPFRRQGYAHEASIALMRWAQSSHGVTRFVLTIRPDNQASQALAASLGFERIGSHIDEVDGLEEILELRLGSDAAVP
jgi:[ribosomal protein S5]-alanine N-acetyltransferase